MSLRGYCWGLWLTLAAPLGAAWALTPDKIAQRAIPSVVLIKTDNALGTGFIVSRDGLIATNLHVIGDARKARVSLADGREFQDVRVVDFNEEHDLLVLRVPAKHLTPLTLGNSARVKVGERVVAIGHPLGLGNTVSDGLVSAVRKLSPTLTVLQVSAPISQGSSGGPLFNEAGEVIGISTLIVAQGQNLNFGMPVDQLKTLLHTRRGTPLAAWRAPGNTIQRAVPQHELSLLEGCDPQRLQEIRGAIEAAIKIGAPLYNDGNHEACYRVYAAAALGINRKQDRCNGPARALLEGVEHADAADDWTSKAWAMRDAFDGVLDVIRRASSPGDEAAPPLGAPQRQVPQHALSLLDGCSGDQLQYIGTTIAGAIHSGAPLYNAGQVEACYRVYEGAILDIMRQAKNCAGPSRALGAALHEAAQRDGFSDKAWALRDGFDGVLDVLSRRKP